MKKQIFILLLFWFSKYSAQILSLEYDFYLQSPVVSTTFHQTGHLAVNGEYSIYEVLPVDNISEGRHTSDDGSLIIVRKDDFKYVHYADRTHIFSQDKLQGKIYNLKDLKPKLYWIMSAETKELDGMKLHKATTAFRGRNYVIWYDPNVSIAAGPWKFYGLNYLIVEAYSEDGKAKWKLKKKPTSQKIDFINPFLNVVEFKPYTLYPELAYGLSPELKMALSQNPNNKIFEQARTQLETQFEWE